MREEGSLLSALGKHARESAAHVHLRAAVEHHGGIWRHKLGKLLLRERPAVEHVEVGFQKEQAW